MSDSENDSSLPSESEDESPKIAPKKKIISPAAAAAAATGAAAPAAAAAADSDLDDDETDDDVSAVATEDDDAAADSDADSDAADGDYAGAGDDDEDADAPPTQARNIPGRFEINEEEEEGDDPDDYMQKFDENTRRNIVKEFYPELVQQSTEEVEALSTVIRDKDGIICDPLHKTIPILTKYEKTRILGERSIQLNNGAAPVIDVEEGLIDSYLIANKELEQKCIPFIIKRPIPNGSCEYWKIRDVEIL